MLGDVPLLDVSDQSLVATAPDAVAGDPWGPCRVDLWLPGLGVAEVLDRGREGRLWRAWAVTAEVRWRGTAEVYLEPWHDSTVVHLYVRLDPVGSAGTAAVAVDGRQVDRWRAQLVARWRHHAWQWRDMRTAGRQPGTAALKVTARGVDR